MNAAHDRRAFLEVVLDRLLEAAHLDPRTVVALPVLPAVNSRRVGHARGRAGYLAELELPGLSREGEAEQDRNRRARLAEYFDVAAMADLQDAEQSGIAGGGAEVEANQRRHAPDEVVRMVAVGPARLAERAILIGDVRLGHRHLHERRDARQACLRHPLGMVCLVDELVQSQMVSPLVHGQLEEERLGGPTEHLLELGAEARVLRPVGREVWVVVGLLVRLRERAGVAREEHPLQVGVGVVRRAVAVGVIDDSELALHEEQVVEDVDAGEVIG